MDRQSGLRNKVAIVGVGATRQGTHAGVGAYELALQALREALVDAGLEKDRLDGVLGANLQGAGIDPVRMSRLIGVGPRVTGSLDYGTGGFTTQYAAFLIATGVCEVVACVFGRDPSGAMVAFSGADTYDHAHRFHNAAAVRAMGWARHMAKYGTTERTLAHVAVTSRRNARLNPLAAFRQPLDFDDYFADPFVVWPFRALDIAKVTAGGCAIIMARADIAADCAKEPIYLHSVGRQQAPRTLDSEEHFLLHGMKDVAEQVYDGSIGPSDVDVLAVSDASTAAIPHTLENFGFCDEGASEDFILSGTIDLGGRLPVNPDGGQLSGGYLVGWLHHVELVRQLRGEAGPRQVAKASVGQYCTTGRFLEDYLSSIYVTREVIA